MQQVEVLAHQARNPVGEKRLVLHRRLEKVHRLRSRNTTDVVHLLGTKGDDRAVLLGSRLERLVSLEAKCLHVPRLQVQNGRERRLSIRPLLVNLNRVVRALVDLTNLGRHIELAIDFLELGTQLLPQLDHRLLTARTEVVDDRNRGATTNRGYDVRALRLNEESGVFHRLITLHFFCDLLRDLQSPFEGVGMEHLGRAKHQGQRRLLKVEAMAEIGRRLPLHEHQVGLDRGADVESTMKLLVRGNFREVEVEVEALTGNDLLVRADQHVAQAAGIERSPNAERVTQLDVEVRVTLDVVRHDWHDGKKNPRQSEENESHVEHATPRCYRWYITIFVETKNGETPYKVSLFH